MEALGSPSILRAPMGGSHAFRKLVYADYRYNDINYRSLPEIHFTALGFFLRLLTVCARFCLCFFLVFFFASLHIMKSRKKKGKKKSA